MTALIQNFSIPANNDTVLSVDVGPDNENLTLAGATIYWKVFAQTAGVPYGDPLISKSTNEGGGIEVLDNTYQLFTIELDRSETAGLLGNYYHETRIISALDDRVTVNQGIVCITMAEVD